MRRLLLILLSVMMICGVVSAQEPSELAAEDVSFAEGVDVYGQAALIAEGNLANQSEDSAYNNLSLFADVYDAEGQVIGEGFGYLVNACGVALTDFELQPGESHPFTLTLELYEDGTIPDRIEVIPEGSAIEARTDDIELPDSVQRVTTDEVVALEWIDAISLRYGVGCANHVFTEFEWHNYNLNTGLAIERENPNVERVTDALLVQAGLTEDIYYRHSFLTFSPTSRRIIYQNDLNAFITAEPDGSFKRILFEDLFRHSLQGVLWQPEGVFLAYYFGAYGESVLYFTGTADGQQLSNTIYDNPPSLIVPGPTTDGRNAVIALDVDGVTGYYLKDVVYDINELLFEGEAPGNNYPAPLYTSRETDDFIYIVRPVEDEPYLQCFDMQTRELHDLVPLPLNLGSEARAWTWLSPDGFTLALGANGTNSGLWLIDLTAFDVCQ